jgi:hypothetical protein
MVEWARHEESRNWDRQQVRIPADEPVKKVPVC